MELERLLAGIGRRVATLGVFLQGLDPKHASGRRANRRVSPVDGDVCGLAAARRGRRSEARRRSEGARARACDRRRSWEWSARSSSSPLTRSGRLSRLPCGHPARGSSPRGSPPGAPSPPAPRCAWPSRPPHGDPPQPPRAPARPRLCFTLQFTAIRLGRLLAVLGLHLGAQHGALSLGFTFSSSRIASASWRLASAASAAASSCATEAASCSRPSRASSSSPVILPAASLAFPIARPTRPPVGVCGCPSIVCPCFREVTESGRARTP